MTILEKDVLGMPDPNPLLHVCHGSRGPISKWVLGYEPTDDTLRETTSTRADLPEGWRIGMYEYFEQTDRTQFYIGWKELLDGYQGYYKFTWTPNGDAVRDPLWGEDISLKCDPAGTVQFGIVSDGTRAYSRAYIGGTVPRTDFLVIDSDGTIAETINITSENERRGEGAGSGIKLNPQNMAIRDNRIFLYGGCYRALVDYYRYEESGDIDDFYVWGNGQGDYVGDKSFQIDAEVPWDCGGEPDMNQIVADTNHFSSSIISAAGAVSFNLMGPDGTGIGDFAYAGEINGLKMAMGICDAGSAYDGLYSDNLTPLVEGEAATGVRFAAQDSFKGIITSKSVGVAENAPAAFSVAQNLPNPFNPTTTINFSLPDAGIVSIDVYNVAGQKVDTIANEYMNTGSHSVVWDASGFSAGVYFYTVKFNNFTKSMKMTLMK